MLACRTPAMKSNLLSVQCSTFQEMNRANSIIDEKFYQKVNHVTVTISYMNNGKFPVQTHATPFAQF